MTLPAYFLFALLVSLYNNRIGPEGMQALAKSLQTNTVLTKLRLVALSLRWAKGCTFCPRYQSVQLR